MKKCNICMGQAEEQYHKFGKSMLSKGYIYKMLREKCKHTEQEKEKDFRENFNSYIEQ